jgi:hypothetical protein
MLVPTKWITLSIIVGVSLVNAIDAPTRSLLHDPEVPSFTNDKLGITIENLSSLHPHSSRRQLRNLVPPYQEFSSFDSIQFIDSKSRNSKNLPGTFGSFREPPTTTSSPQTAFIRTSSPSPFRRRSDEYDDSIGTYPASQIAFDLNYDFDYANEDNVTAATLLTTTTTTQETPAIRAVGSEQYKKFQNKIIPISFAPQQLHDDNESSQSDEHEKQQQQQQEEEEDVNDSDDADNESKHQRDSKQLDNDSDGDDDKKIRFPDDEESSNEDQPHAEALTARRSGIQFSENESEIRQQNYNPFIPQSYSEESLNFGDTISNLQRPFHNEEQLYGLDINENERLGGNRYYRPFIAPFRDDDVTKFGDAQGGPVTGFNNRQVRDSVVFFPRTQYESTASGSGYFEPESSRPPRHFFPSKVYTEYPDFVSSPSSPASAKYYQQPSPTYTWKSRQPRVVFPAATTSSTDFGPGTTYVGNDNVVFR